MSHQTDSHFTKLAELTVPAKRAAYSDRMAWMMALLSAIVYERFDEESDDVLMKLAEELAALASGSDAPPGDRIALFRWRGGKWSTESELTLGSPQHDSVHRSRVSFAAQVTSVSAPRSASQGYWVYSRSGGRTSFC